MTTLEAESNYPEDYSEAYVIDEENLPMISPEKIIEPTTVVAEPVPQKLQVLKSIPKKNILSMFTSSKDDNLNLFKNTCLDTEKYALSDNEKGMLDEVLRWYKTNQKPKFIKDKIEYYCDVRDALSFDPELELKYPKLYVWTLYYALTNKQNQVKSNIKNFKTLDESVLQRQENFMDPQPGSAQLIDELNRELGVGIRIPTIKRGGTKRRRKNTKKRKTRKSRKNKSIRYNL